MSLFRPASGPHPGPVERFLGSAAAAGGPFALLELPPQLCDEENILAALDRQLERVHKHPECDTPEADEVRLALHAAAAQLLDPGVRRQMLTRWAGVVAPAVPVRSAPVPADRLLEHDAILTLGLYGGWNRRSLQRLVWLAHARGLSSEHVAATLRSLARSRRRARSAAAPPRVAPTLRRPAPAVSPPSPPPANAPLPGEIDPAIRLLRTLLIVGAAGVLALAVSIAVIIAAIGDFGSPQPGASGSAPVAAAPGAVPPPVGTPAATEQPDGTAAPAPQGPPTAVAEPQPAPPPKPRAVNVATLGRDIAQAAKAVAGEPDTAASAFELASGDLGANWPRLSKEQLIAAHDSVVEFVYRAAQMPEVTARALTAIARGVEPLGEERPLTEAEVWPAVWSTGMLARLSREKDLSVAAKATVESGLRRALGPAALVDGTFESGAAAVLALIPRRLVTSEQGGPERGKVWARWAEAVEAFAGDTPQRTRLLLAGLETVMVEGPEPDTDRGIYDAITAIGARVTWREADESRRQLIRWFGDRRVSNADLRALTAMLAGRSAAPGVDVTMVLSTAASESSRATLRDRYAAAWGLETAGDADGLITDWINAARDQLQRADTPGDDISHLSRTVALSRLNEAALWQWRGDGPEAAAILSDLEPPGPLPPTTHPQGATDIAITTGSASDANPWGLRYLAARRNIPVRLDLLDQLSSNRGLTAMDAEVLVIEALAGPQAEVRRRAQDLVRRFSAEPVVVNAVLEFLPRAPKVVSNARLIEDVAGRPLPGIKDQSWAITARRSLVERLLELIASEGRHARIDALSRLLAVSYRSRAAAAPLSLSEREEDNQPHPHLSAAAEWAWWRAMADTPLTDGSSAVSLESAERRRAGRVGQAVGFVQTFAAEQVSLCEMIALIVRTERPDRADAVDAVMVRLTDERRRARHIFEQLHATERAITRLWLIRFGEQLG